MNRTSKGVAEEIRRLAANAFKDHVLTLTSGGYWHCAHPNGSSSYSFQIFLAPGAVMVWGDLGEFTLRHSDRDSLGWLLRAAKNGKYHDYFLGKLRATNGEKEEFFFGDAMAYLADAENDCDDRHLFERLQFVRQAMEEVEDDGAKEQERAWWETWRDQGDSDPNPCTGWASGPLWLWEMACTFRRLYEALPVVSDDCDDNACELVEMLLRGNDVGK